MLPREGELIARDRALPGLAMVLHPTALLSALRSAWPARDLDDPQLTYLRYKPGTNCLAAYAVLVDGARTFVHATAHRRGDEAKLYKALTKFGSESALHPVVLPQGVVIRAFPTDRKLGALPLLADPAVRRRVLRRLLPAQPELWKADLDILRYKPERRLVARLRAPDGGRALLKLYHAGDFKRAKAGAEAFSLGQVSSAPLLGADIKRRLLVWNWLDAAPTDVLLDECPAQVEHIGRALATLHAQPPAGLTSVGRADETRPIWAAAKSVAYLLPEHGARVRRLAAFLDAELRAAPELFVPVHGDFSADQVLLTPAGVAIIDFDAAALGDPAWDLGTFRAQLERGVIRGHLTAEVVAAVQSALESGYGARRGSLPPRAALYTAAGLLRLAPHAFRTRQEGWPDETLALLERAETLLGLDEGVSARSPAVAKFENDPELHFAAGALESTTLSPYLTKLFGPHVLRRAELLRHRAGRRALIAYTLERPEGLLRVLGKVRAKGTDLKTHALQTFLWENGFGDASGDGVSVAEPLGVLEPFHMTLQRAVPGSPLETLLHPRAEPLMERIASAAYKLHRTAAPLRRTHTLADELATLRQQLSAVSAVKPSVAARLAQVLSACEALSTGLPVAEPATLHRDLYPEQVLVDGERLYLLDLDLCALGDPALDIGNFAAHLREHALRVFGDAEVLAGLERTLTEHYCTLAGIAVEAVAVYTTLSLARHVAISQRIPARRQLTEPLLALTEAQLGLNAG